jgi:hypothetical protein
LTGTKLTAKIEVLRIESLIPADWNYKNEGSEEDITKLMESILEDSSCGVPLVRVLKKGVYEVVDGNHRLYALQRLGVEEVFCENAGKVSKTKAILMSRRRNQNWFEDDLGKLGVLYRDHIVGIVDPEDLDRIMPGGAEEVLNLVSLVDVDLDSLQMDLDPAGGPDLEGFKITVTLDAEAYGQWKDWMEKVEEVTADGSREESFRLLLYHCKDIVLG